MVVMMHDERKELGNGLEQKVKRILRNRLDAKERKILVDYMGRDMKTGTYNESKFNTDLAIEVQRAERIGGDLSLLYIDVNQFKHYNDTYGHHAGDMILKAVGLCLTQGLRPYDREGVYHLHGDEFAVLIQDPSAENGFKIAERLREYVRIESRKILKELLPKQNIRKPVTTSIGVASYKGICRSVRQLEDNADVALYKSKKVRKAVLFDPKEDYTPFLPGVSARADQSKATSAT